MELKMYFRHTQHYATEATSSVPQASPIVFVGTNPSNVHPVVGVVPIPNYFDVSSDVANIDELQFTWTLGRDSDGAQQAGQTQIKKTATSDLKIEAGAYLFIKDWLIDNVAGTLNSIDVRVEDTSCGLYDEWIITADQIRWCQDAVCEFSVSLNQKDPSLSCIQKTLIADDWQGWFRDQPLNGKKHPRFTYCNEVKPNGMMITLWWLMSIVFSILFIFTPIINIIIIIINVIIAIINAIAWITGQDPVDYVGFFDPLDMAESFYMESSGCGRMHPAPLIRDYIDNVCKKCNVKVDAITDPVFHGTTINIDLSSDRQVRQRANPYYNATYLNSPYKRGIRIFRGLFNNDRNEVDYYITDNRPLLTLDTFLDELKGLFNCEWRVKRVNGEDWLYFWRKDLFSLTSPLYNFQENSEDRNKIIQGICFSWIDKKHPAYLKGLYQSDAGDGCGNEALIYMNDMLAIGSTANNQNFIGELDKTTNFGGTRFRLDGASDDYLCNAMQVLLNGGLLNPNIYAIINNAIKPALTEFADYALLMSGESATLPKVLIWDPNSGYDYARAVRTKSTAPPNINGSPFQLPTINSVYNPENKIWSDLHPPQTYVTGSGLSFGSSPMGKYTVQEYFGIDFYARPAELCNYPMFFSSKFTENIYDFFHWVDDPRVNPKANMEFSLKMELCCEDLQKLGILNDGSNNKLGEKILVPYPFQSEARLTEITVSYDSEDEYGKYIELKGTL